MISYSIELEVTASCVILVFQVVPFDETAINVFAAVEPDAIAQNKLSSGAQTTLLYVNEVFELITFSVQLIPSGEVYDFCVPTAQNMRNADDQHIPCTTTPGLYRGVQVETAFNALLISVMGAFL